MIGLISSNWNELDKITLNFGKTDYAPGRSGNYKYFTIGKNEIVALQSGVGVKNARSAANILINQFRADIILNAGIAGALHPELEVGNIILGDWIYSTKKNLKIMLKPPPSIAFSGNIKHGGVLTSSQFVHLDTVKRCLHQKTGALAVDMESWGIAEVCKKTGKKLIVIKSVSDRSSDILPRFGYILNKSGTIKYNIAIRYFAANPYLFLKYLEFRFINMKKAVSNLNDFLIRFVNCYNCE